MVVGRTNAERSMAEEFGDPKLAGGKEVEEVRGKADSAMSLGLPPLPPNSVTILSARSSESYYFLYSGKLLFMVI
jgi:hypothetical protein